MLIKNNTMKYLVFMNQIVRIINTVLAVTLSISLQAQNVFTEHVSESSFSETYFTYPNFLGNEEHKSFVFNYQINDILQTELRGFYDTYLLENRFRSVIILKLYLSKKMYVLGGGSIEVSTFKSQKNIFHSPRVAIIGGLGYDVNRNFNLELMSDIGINKTTMGAFGEPFIPTPRLYRVKGKIKF